MPINLTFRRGTSQELTTQTGSYGEIAIDTTTDSLVVFDGATPGGIRVASEGAVQSSAPSPAYINVATMKTQSVAVGTIVETQGYYTAGDGGHAQYLIQSGVTADGWGDHVMADGNVAVLMYNNRIHALQYGLHNDGVTDSRIPMQALAATGLPVIFPYRGSFVLVYKRSGINLYNGEITTVRFENDVDFNHSRIIFRHRVDSNGNPAGDELGYAPTPMLELGTPNRWVTHASNSPLVTLLKSTPTIEGKAIPGLVGQSQWANQLIEIQTNVDFFIFRNQSIFKRRELFVHTRDGQVTLPTKYPLATSTITGARTMILNEKHTTYENIVIDLREMDHTLAMTQFVYVREADNVTVKNINVLDLALERWTYASSGLAIITVDSTANCTIQDYYSPWAAQATATDTNSAFKNAYLLALRDNVNIIMDGVIAVGDGYGMVGTDENWGMTWRNCDVNRINSHKPFRNFLKVQDSKIGGHGIKTAAIGDLIVERCTFVGGVFWLGGHRWFSNRPDHGGYADGHLIVRDCIFQNTKGSPGFVQEADGVTTGSNWGGHAYGYAVPPSSPITPWNWQTQTYDNCILEQGTMIFGNWTRGTSWTYETEQLTVRNCRAHNGAKWIVESNHAQNVIGRARSSGWEIHESNNNTTAVWWEKPHNFYREVDGEWYGVRPNKRINLIDSDIDSIIMRPEALTGVLDITIENCRSNDVTAGIVIEPQYRGIYKITDSVIKSLNTSTTNGEVKIIAQNNTFVTSPVTGTETTWIESNNNYLS